MRAVYSCLFFVGWLILPAQAADAQDWLSRLADAERRQNFQGTFVYERNGSFSTHSIWHRVEDGEVHERLLQLDGPPQEVVRVNGTPQCVSGNLVDQVAEGPVWATRELDPKQLANWYDLRVIGESRVAGRPAVVLAILPKDQHRYGFELHLDRETALPLKSLLLNEKGQLLERFQFTHLGTSEVVAEQMLKPGTGCQAVQFAEARSVAPDTWRSEWLPPGFELTRMLERRSPASSESIAYLMYGDGLARFSVFLEPLRGELIEDARSQLGPTVVVSKRMSTADGDIMVTVVGEIPLGTAERVALSMRSGKAGPEQ